MTDLESLRDAVTAVIDASDEVSDVLFGLNVCLPVKSLSQTVGVETVKQLTTASIVWVSPIYHSECGSEFHILFEFDSLSRCLQVTLDSVVYEEAEVGSPKVGERGGRTTVNTE